MQWFFQMIKKSKCRKKSWRVAVWPCLWHTLACATAADKFLIDQTEIANWMKQNNVNITTYYSALRLIGSRIKESDIYGPIILQQYTKTSVNLIIRLLLSALCWPKVSLLIGGHCNVSYAYYFDLPFHKISWQL
jgi:hypothetical protein